MQSGTGQAGLEELDARARHDLACLNVPPANWPMPRTGSDRRPALDVLVVGGGQLGQTAAFALIRAGIRNLRVIDRAPRGQEGPWATTARMKTLRSPKHLTGPDLGVPSLTFRAWYEAQHGAAGWETLYKIDRETWVDYLLWVRATAAIPVENDVSLAELAPDGELFAARLSRAGGEIEDIGARHVVLALGRDGYGGARLPAFPSFRETEGPHGRAFHTGEPIDFARFRGGRVAVLGANASAFDNAGMALESGAGVVMWSRRAHLPQVNFTRGMTPGFLTGFPALDDATRWAVMARLADEAAPPPHESVLRCTTHPGFELRFGEGWLDLSADAEGVDVATLRGNERFDAAILGTGYGLDLQRQPALAPFVSHARLWREVVPTEAAALYPELARHPYLDAGFGLMSCDGADGTLGRIHLLGPPAAVSHGTLAADIPGIAPTALRLADAVARALFLDDAGSLEERLFGFDEPELSPTPYFVARTARTGRSGIKTSGPP